MTTMRAKNKNRQKGMVLLAVVWSVFVLAAIAFALSTMVRGSSEELHARKEHLQAYYVARGAVYRTVSMLKQPQATLSQPLPFRPGASRLEWAEGDMRVTVDVMDESGKLDLNGADPAMLEKLFENLGMDYIAAHNLVAAVEDWRDTDDDTRLGGAESGYYMTLPQPYRSANRDFRNVEELLLVRGVTRDMFYGGLQVGERGSVVRRLGLIDCLTVHSHGSAVNINYAPLPVLLSVPRLSPEVARFMLEGRARHPFAAVPEFTHDYPVLLDGETMSHLTAGSAGPYSVVVSATTSNGITARVRTTVKVNGLDTRTQDNQVKPGPPFLILDWDDSYVG